MGVWDGCKNHCNVFGVVGSLYKFYNFVTVQKLELSKKSLRDQVKKNWSWAKKSVRDQFNTWVSSGCQLQILHTMSSMLFQGTEPFV